MAVTESKAYDLRNVQYQGTRIGGTDQITISPIQYQGTPVNYVKYKNRDILHRYSVRNGDKYDNFYEYDADYIGETAGVYSVSSTSKYDSKTTDIPAPEPYSDRTIQYEYYITKYELTRTSGTKNESKYYLYAFTIILYAFYREEGHPTITHSKKIRADKYDYLSTEDISLDTLAAQIEDPSGSDEGFTPPWKLGISTEDILENTRRERERTDDIICKGNFINFTGTTETEDEGTPSSWGDEFEYYYSGIFNQGAEDLTVDYYEHSQYGSLSTIFANGRLFNFNRVVNSLSEVDSDHVCITDCDWDSIHSSCWIDNGMDDRRPIYIKEGHGRYISSNDFEHFPLIFLICSSCSNSALSDGLENLSLSYYREDITLIGANITYDNYIWGRDY